MFIGNFSSTSSISAYTNIPVATVMNTNTKVKNNTTSNTIDILKSGIYKVNANLDVSGVTGTSVTAQIYADGNAVSGASATSEITTGTGAVTLPLQYAFKVSPSTDGYASISVQCNTAITPSGNIVVEYVQ